MDMFLQLLPIAVFGTLFVFIIKRYGFNRKVALITLVVSLVVGAIQVSWENIFAGLFQLIFATMGAFLLLYIVFGATYGIVSKGKRKL